MEIHGTANLEFASSKDVLETIKGAALVLNLEADANLSITDLYTETETDYKVVFYIDGQIKYKGFVKPDGLYTDFVNEEYLITLDCVDGLGILKNLSFVDDDGFHFTGWMKEKDIIYYCLKRTSLDLPINVCIDVFHEFITDETNQDITDKTMLSTNRFYKEDNDTVMDCEEVLKSVLEKYNAVIHQENGEWFIYRPIDIANSMSFFRYVDNTFISKVTKVVGFNLGSQINGFFPHHCNADQRISLHGSVAAYRVSYKYGIFKSFFTNPNFNFDGSTLPGWTINPTHYFYTPTPSPIVFNFNKSWLKYYSVFPPGNNVEVTSDAVTVQSGDLLKVQFTIENSGQYVSALFRLKLTNGTTTKYLSDGHWVDTETLITIENFYTLGYTHAFSGSPDEYEAGQYGNGETTWEMVIDGVPFDGNITVEIITPIFYVSGYQDGQYEANLGESYMFYKSFKLIPQDKGNELIKGEFHTITRVPKPSSIIKDNKTVYNGDLKSDIFEGVIHDNKGKNTSKWHRKGITEEKAILEIMVEDSMRIKAKPSKIFEGSVFGFFDFFKKIDIDNVEGVFYPTSYTYDSVSDIVKIKVSEIFSDYLSADKILYEKTFDYGTVVKPTIKS